MLLSPLLATGQSLHLYLLACRPACLLAATSRTAFGLSRFNSLIPSVSHTPLASFRQHPSFATSYQQQQLAAATILAAATGRGGPGGGVAGQRHGHRDALDGGGGGFDNRGCRGHGEEGSVATSPDASPTSLIAGLGINVGLLQPSPLLWLLGARSIEAVPLAQLHCRCRWRWSTSGTSSLESFWARAQVRDHLAGRASTHHLRAMLACALTQAGCMTAPLHGAVTSLLLLRAEGSVYAAWYQETPVAVKKTQSLMEIEMNLHAGESRPTEHCLMHGMHRCRRCDAAGLQSRHAAPHAWPRLMYLFASDWRVLPAHVACLGASPHHYPQVPTTTLSGCAACAPMAATSTSSWSSAPGKYKNNTEQNNKCHVQQHQQLPRKVRRSPADWRRPLPPSAPCRGTLDVLIHKGQGSSHRLDPLKLLPIVRSMARGMLHLHTRRPAIFHRWGTWCMGLMSSMFVLRPPLQ